MQLSVRDLDGIYGNESCIARERNLLLWMEVNKIVRENKSMKKSLPMDWPKSFRTDWEPLEDATKNGLHTNYICWCAEKISLWFNMVFLRSGGMFSKRKKQNRKIEWGQGKLEQKIKSEWWVSKPNAIRGSLNGCVS